MTPRITSATTKVGIVLVAVIVSFGVGLGVALLAGQAAGTAVLLAVTVATVVFCGRTFRAAGEPIRPARPAWKLTGGATSSVVLTAFFVWQALGDVVGTSSDGRSAASTVMSTVVYAALAAAYLVSALTQRAARSHERSRGTLG
ncbi:hypothetical protein [Frigoribacterium faeni]|uniref:hypothetical protein n=1 Tax=Frigoribacterium faeni TaxID=145483 RepID=UPI00141A7F52|nr:hypothetical protein [Frigoribacterium faeni]NIJ06354.1 hypothetical protein [Frigoribacterium faeni]